MNKQTLTKTKLIRGMQCPKQLYLMIHKKEEAVEDSSGQIKELGTSIGEEARKRYPNGNLVKSLDMEGSLSETAPLLAKGSVIFEAAFLYSDFFCRVDVLEVSEKGEMSITEVKATSFKPGDKVKEHQILDAIVQYVILVNLGYKVKKVSLLLINKNYTLNGKEDLFVEIDITETAKERKDKVEKEMHNLLTVSCSDSEPRIEIGPHCNNPIECPFKDYCLKNKQLPEISVLNLQNFPKKYDYLSKGIVDLDKLDLKVMTDGQKEQVRKLKLTSPEINKKEVKKIFEEWKGTLFFLDFEAFAPANPLFPSTSPFTKIPYQFSCYSIKKNKIVHEMSFLAEELNSDPRIEIAKNLINILGKEGKIVVYNQGFEKSIIKEMAELYPDLKKDLESINERVVDLLDVVKKNVYYPAFKNRFSIKVVAPAMLGQDSSYKDMKVSNGMDSVKTFLDAIRDGRITEVKHSLIEYCDKDVLEMIRIYQKIKEELK